MKCEKCRRKATIKTIDGHFCDNHLPIGFCPGCGELVLGVYWHEEHINLLGVCGNCAESIRNNVDSKSSVSFFTNLIELMCEKERKINMAKTAKSVKVPNLKTLSKDELILLYADESRRFREEASGLSAVLYLLVDELAKQPQFGSIREKIDKYLTENKPTLAASLIQQHLEEQGSRGSGAVIPDEYRIITYGGEFDEQFLEPPIEEKTDDKKPSIIPSYDAITY